jgi:hypothetical protein
MCQLSHVCLALSAQQIYMKFADVFQSRFKSDNSSGHLTSLGAPRRMFIVGSFVIGEEYDFLGCHAV